MSLQPARFVHSSWIRVAAISAVLFASTARAQTAPKPVAGENVNMVNGLGWPDGDPFLERQNEPSIAVSSKNPNNLLAAANDYRSVDYPVTVGEPNGDAWQGIYKSFDGGQTWKSTLLPGYWNDKSYGGSNLDPSSPIFGYQAAADPVVRPGPNGMFYLSGIAFNRTGKNLGQIFISRFADLNDNTETPQAIGNWTDAIRYVDTQTIDLGTAGQFMDKPWIVIDKTRASAGPCTITPRNAPAFTISAGFNVYIVYASFTGSTSSKIMFRRSRDCGNTWDQPQKLSESNSINQGTTMAVDPTDGSINIAWRRFVTSSQPDAIVFARSTDFGSTFSKTVDIATPKSKPLVGGAFFDQQDAPHAGATTATSFRTSSFPSLAVSVYRDSTGKYVSNVHVAWPYRLGTTTGDARILLASAPVGSSTSAGAWTINTQPLDDQPAPTATPVGRHQFMPALTFTQGRLMLLYYTSLRDQQREYVTLSFDSNGVPTWSSTFLDFTEAGGLGAFLDDYGLKVRHMIDVRVGSAIPNASPSFVTIPVSRYPFGEVGDTSLVSTGTSVTDNTSIVSKQLGFNPPNLPLFAKGTVPFIGDYIDIAGRIFTQLANGSYDYVLEAGSGIVHHAIWTSNRDVRPPPLLIDAYGNPYRDWSRHTIVPLISGSTVSTLDGSTLPTTSICTTADDALYTGTRDQNIYTSRLTEGFDVWTPVNVKPLDADRNFVVVLNNTTIQPLWIRMNVTGVPNPAQNVSFTNLIAGTSNVSSIDIRLDKQSVGYQAFWVRAFGQKNAPFTLNAYQINAQGCNESTDPTCKVANGYSGFLIFNPPGSNVDAYSLLGKPDPVSSGTFGAGTTSYTIFGQTAFGQTAFGQTAFGQTAFGQTAFGQTAFGQTAFGQTAFGQTAAAIGETTYTYTNPNSTSTVYTVTVNNPNATVVVKRKTPTRATSGVCIAGSVDQTVITKGQTAVGATSSSLNASILVPPNETVVLSVSSPLAGSSSTDATTLQGLANDAAITNAPVACPDLGSSNCVAPFMTITTTALAPATAIVGQDYSATVKAIGPRTNYSQWSWQIKGSASAGLTITGNGDGTATINGPATAACSTSGCQVTVTVTDTSVPSTDPNASAATATKSFPLQVTKPPTTTTLTLNGYPNNLTTFYGLPVKIDATVNPGAIANGAPSGTLSITGTYPCPGTATNTLASSQVTVTSFPATLESTPVLGAGSYCITGAYSQDPRYADSSASLSVTVNPAPTTVSSVSLSPATPVTGQPVTVSAVVTSSIAGVVPTGSVAFYDLGATCPVTLPDPSTIATGSLGTATGPFSLSPLSFSVGSHCIAAYFSNAPNFVPSAGMTTVTVGAASTMTSLAVTDASGNPLSTDPATGVSYATYGTTVTFTAEVDVIAPGIGTPTGSVQFYDAATAKVLGEVALGSNGAPANQAILQYSTLDAKDTSGAAIQHQIQATYLPPTAPSPAPYSTSTSTPPFPLTVKPVSDTLTLTASSNGIALTTGTILYGQSVTLTASISGGLIPAGAVAFYDLKTCPATLNLSGATPVSSTSLVAGSTSASYMFTPTSGNHCFVAEFTGLDVVTVDSNMLPFTDAYLFSGYGSPLNTAVSYPLQPGQTVTMSSGSKSAGSVVPIKYSVTGATGVLSDASSAGPTLGIYAFDQTNATGGCNAIPLTPPIPQPTADTQTAIILYVNGKVAAGGSTFRFDSTGQQFVFNWDTSKAPTSKLQPPRKGCWEIVTYLRDQTQKATYLILN